MTLPADIETNPAAYAGWKFFRISHNATQPDKDLYRALPP